MDLHDCDYVKLKTHGYCSPTKTKPDDKITHFIVEFTMGAHLGFGLELEECIVKFLIIYCQFPHLRPYSLPGLLLEGLGIVLLLLSLTHLHDTSGLSRKR